MRNRREMLFVLVLLFFVCVSQTMAQTTGKISGTVKDAENGSPLIGANVILDGTSFGAATGLDGSFFIINIPPGIYNAKISMMGYETQLIANLKVSVNRTSGLNAELRATVLETGEVVVVQADKISVKKDQTGSIRNVSSSDIEMLPVESTGAVVNMQAGVVQGRFRGGRTGEVSYMIDGMQVDNALDRGRGIDLDVDAVSDLEVITGTFNAEYGRAMSGIVNAVSKEGSNEFHGSAGGFWAGYYTTHDDVWYGLESNINRNQDYKFSLDGPIIKNHLTFAINGRYQKNDNYLVGIRRFNMTDYSDYSNYPTSYTTEATGDSAYVPMNNNESWNLSGKLAWKMQNKKLSLLYVFNDAVYHTYQNEYHDYRTFMYAPDGRRASYPRSHLTTLQWNHMFSQKAFYEAKFSYLHRYDGDYLYEDPLDPGYIHDMYLSNNELTGFYTGGQDKDHYTAISKRYDAKIDLTWQVNKNHAIKTGMLYTQHSFDQKSYEILNKYRNTAFESTYYKPEILPDSTIYSDIYMKEPVEAAFYIQDKMEFEEMVINLGVRYEYFDPATTYPTQLRNPGNLLDFPDNPEKMSDYPSSEAKASISPRFGLSYQLGQSALLRFSYGHFLQFPAFNTMYQNNSYVLGTTSYETIIGYPEVEPEKTVNYELGYWQKISDNMDCEIAMFYKDIYDLSTVNMYNTYNNVWYGVYGNKDYGNVRGLEVKYNFYWNRVVVNMNYTLQYTRGNADDPELTFDRAGDNQDPIPTLIPLGWDQRHTANLTVGYNTEKYGLTATAYYGSGGVYTWQAIPENRLARVNLYPNNAYKPSTLSVDLRGHYELVEFQGIKTSLTLQVYNLLDKLNEYGVDSYTGRANQTIIRPEQILNHKSDWVTYEERIFNPNNYSAPRQVKLGLEMRF